MKILNILQKGNWTAKYGYTSSGLGLPVEFLLMEYDGKGGTTTIPLVPPIRVCEYDKNDSISNLPKPYSVKEFKEVFREFKEEAKKKLKL